MNVLFLTLLDFNSIDEHNIYTDLLREFAKRDNRVYAISPVERRKKQITKLIKEQNATILKLKIGNMQKTNCIGKRDFYIDSRIPFFRSNKKIFFRC